jgi:hypothetical protein
MLGSFALLPLGFAASGLVASAIGSTLTLILAGIFVILACLLPLSLSAVRALR